MKENKLYVSKSCLVLLSFFALWSSTLHILILLRKTKKKWKFYQTSFYKIRQINKVAFLASLHSQFFLLFFRRSHLVCGWACCSQVIAQSHTLLLYVNPLVLEEVKEAKEADFSSEKWSPNPNLSWGLLMIGL